MSKQTSARVGVPPLSIAGIAVSVTAIAGALLAPPLGVALAFVGFVLSGLGLLIHRDAAPPRRAAMLGVAVSTTAFIVILWLTLTTTTVRG